MPVDAWTAIAEKIRPLQSCTVHHQTVAIPVDIPTRWEPRAKQSRTVALLTALCAAALFESCTVHHKKKSPDQMVGIFLGRHS